jgi:5'/3'-nucleotidase SurE
MGRARTGTHARPPDGRPSNDDGIDAPGIAALRDALQSVASVTVVAPAEDHSGAGRRADREFRVRDHPRGHTVTGTPADCVAYGLHVVDDPDFVVAGANDGPNVGADNVGRSATVGAAAEAAYLGHAGVAVSTYHPEEGRVPDPSRADFAAAGDLARHVVDTVAPETLVERDAYLSANVPTRVDADTASDSPNRSTTTRSASKHLATPNHRATASPPALADRPVTATTSRARSTTRSAPTATNR